MSNFTLMKDIINHTTVKGYDLYESYQFDKATASRKNIETLRNWIDALHPDLQERFMVIFKTIISPRLSIM